MKSIKKFSAMSAKDQPITESAKVTKEAVDELIKKIGFNSIEELKKEKDLLSKLEAMSKTFAKSNDISEDDVDEDRAEDIEDEMKAKGDPKSLEGTEDKDGDEEVVASAEEEVEEDRAEDIEDEVLAVGKTKSLTDKEGEEVTPDQEITKEVPAEAPEVEDKGGVDVEDDDSENEEIETPKATRRIMAFEDFIKEKEETINKNISYHDDDEEPEDYAVPVAASADPLAESDETRGKDDEKEGDELEDKGDKKVDDEDEKEKADHYKGAVKSDDKQIDALKKDAKYDKEEEEDAEKNESTILSFAGFVNEAYDKVVWGGDKGDKSKTKEDEEDYEDEDKTDEKFDDVVLGGNKGDKSKTKEGEEDYEDEDKKDEKFDDVVLGGNKGDKSKTKDGEEDYEDEDKKDEKFDEVTLGGNKGDKSKTKKGEEDYEDEKDESVTETEETAAKALTIADDAKAMGTGAAGVVIPEVKGDGSETAAGIAAGVMARGKVKDLSSLAGKLVTPDQKVTEVIPDEANDVSEDGIEIPLVKEEVLDDDSIAEKFRKIATNKFKLNEADITSDDQFKDYATNLLKDAFGDDYDEKKATSVIDGLLSTHKDDYGAMVGALQSSMG
jgi:hypothetical protein